MFHPTKFIPGYDRREEQTSPTPDGLDMRGDCCRGSLLTLILDESKSILMKLFL
jgi:hypothetical protein